MNLIRQSHPYDKRVSATSIGTGFPWLGTIDRAISRSRELTPADRRWAYAQLMTLAQAELTIIPDDDPSRAGYRKWIARFKERIRELG